MLACSGSGARCLGMGALRRRIDGPFLCFSLKKNTQNQKNFPGLRPGGGEGPCTPWIFGRGGAGRRDFGLQAPGCYRFLTVVNCLSQIQSILGAARARQPRGWFGPIGPSSMKRLTIKPAGTRRASRNVCLGGTEVRRFGVRAVWVSSPRLSVSWRSARCVLPSGGGASGGAVLVDSGRARRPFRCCLRGPDCSVRLERACYGGVSAHLENRAIHSPPG